MVCMYYCLLAVDVCFIGGELIGNELRESGCGCVSTKLTCNNNNNNCYNYKYNVHVHVHAIVDTIRYKRQHHVAHRT